MNDHPREPLARWALVVATASIANGAMPLAVSSQDPGATVQANLKSAYEYLQTVRSMGFLHLVPDAYYRIGTAYLNVGAGDSALAFLDSAMAMSDDLDLQVSALTRIGEWYYSKSIDDESERAWACFGVAFRLMTRLTEGVSGRMRLGAGDLLDAIAQRWVAASLRLRGSYDEATVAVLITLIQRASRAPHWRNDARWPLPEGLERLAAAACTNGTTSIDSAVTKMVATGNRITDGVSRSDEGLIEYGIVPDGLVITWWTAGAPPSLYVRRLINDEALVRAIDAGFGPRERIEANLNQVRDSLEVLTACLRMEIGVDIGVRRASRSGVALSRGMPVCGGEAVDEGGVSDVGAFLAELLLPDDLPETPTQIDGLTVAPVGPLWLIPFAALPIGDSFAGVKWRISYQPSAEARQASPLTLGDLDNALVVGNPAMPDTAEWSALPDAGAEAVGVAELLGVPADTGSAATEDMVVRRLLNSTIAHFATHAQAEIGGRKGVLVLSNGSSERLTGDGYLTVDEVLAGPPLTAVRLLVLSACETSIGELWTAAGLNSLERAFLVKGVNQVLSSLWPVDSEVTKLFMLEFYSALVDQTASGDIGRAMRIARNTVKEQHKEPYYWAAFRLVRR